MVDSTPVELRPIHLAWNLSFVTAARISLRANLAGVGPLKPDAVGPTNLDKLMRRDLDAVVAGLTMHYNSGAVEGTVNRIKQLKAAIYGRAKPDLLRKRILLA